MPTHDSNHEDDSEELVALRQTVRDLVATYKSWEKQGSIPQSVKRVFSIIETRPEVRRACHTTRKS